MSYISKNIRSFVSSLIFAAVIFICICGGGQKIFAQDCPPDDPKERFKEITVCSLLSALKREGLTPDQRNKALINVVKTRGIKFVMTDDVELQFREAGASDALLAAIGKESAKLETTPSGYIYLGNKYLGEATKMSSRADNLRNQVLQKTFEKNEEEAKKLKEEADKLEMQAQENAQKAIPFLNQAKLAEPDSTTEFSSTADGNLAAAYGILKDYDKAIDYATQAIDLEKTASRYYNRAVLYDQKARATTDMKEKRAIHDKALADIDQALSLDSTMGYARQLSISIKKLWGIQ